MLTNLVVTVCVVAVTLALGWFTWSMRRATNAFAKWGILIIGGFVTLILAFVSFASTKGMFDVYGPRGTPPRQMTVERTPERIARGEHITNMMCADCHAVNKQLPLTGGHNLSDDAHMPLGVLQPYNLTPAGPLKDMTDGEIFRAIRQGADKNGKRLLVMSAQRVRNLSDEDLQSVIAYLRSAPAVQNETKQEAPSFLTVAMAGAGMLPTLPGYPPDSITAPPAGPTLEYGKYMVRWAGCDECHGANLTGGGGGVLPKGPSLRSVKNWTAEGFIATLRTGKTPYGKMLDSTMMPWKIFGRASDDELTAIHTYLVSLP
ncbi:MAG TPA: cytochrome c [Gemmatimonadaceae bacterium]